MRRRTVSEPHVTEPPEERLTVTTRPTTLLRSVSEIGIMRPPTRPDNDHVYVASGDIPDELAPARPLLSTNLGPPPADQLFHRSPSDHRVPALRLSAAECRAPPR